MDSEHSAYVSAQSKHHRYMHHFKKQRYIEVFQCSGDDMNLVLTGGIAPKSSLLQNPNAHAAHVLQQLHAATSAAAAAGGQQVLNHHAHHGHHHHHVHAGTQFGGTSGSGGALLNGGSHGLGGGGMISPPLVFAGVGGGGGGQVGGVPPAFLLNRPFMRGGAFGHGALLHGGLVAPQYVFHQQRPMEHDLFGNRFLGAVPGGQGVLVGKRAWEDAFGASGLEHQMLGVPAPKRWVGGLGSPVHAHHHHQHQAAAVAQHQAALNAAAAAAQAAMNGGGGNSPGSLVGGFNIGSNVSGGGRLGGR